MCHNVVFEFYLNYYVIYGFILFVIKPICIYLQVSVKVKEIGGMSIVTAH